MEKIELNDIKPIDIIADGEGSTIYRLEGAKILKVAKALTIQNCIFAGVDYEQKILNTSARSVKEIVSPLAAVYSGRRCVGYIAEEIKGQTLNEKYDDYDINQLTNLYEYYNVMKKIEELVIKGNKVGIVFPDLCTCDNTMITENGEIKYIDYDGLQLGKNDRAITFSSSLGDATKYLLNSKFTTAPFHLTPEIDKTSLTILMFLWVFNIDLTKIGKRLPDGKVIELKDIFQTINLDDEILFNKVLKNLDTKEKGVFIMEDLHRIAENYTMKALSTPIPGAYLKKLIRK